MKKIKSNKLIIIFLIPILFLVCSPVKAEIRYDVEEMIISENGVTFKGWAILTGYNNYGGYLSEILITATDGSTKITKSNYSGTNSNAALNAYKLNGSIENNFYKVLCYNRNSTANSCYKESDAKCSDQNDCTYRNINFSITFTTDELKTMLGKNISFKLTVRAINNNRDTSNGNLTKNFSIYQSLSSATNVTSETIAMGVYQNNCKIATTNTICTAGSKIGDMILNTISSNAQFQITHKYTYVQQGDTNFPTTVTSLSRYLNGTTNYHWNTNDAVTKNIAARTSNRIVYSGSGAYQYAYSLTPLPTGATVNYGYAYASWGRISTELNLKFDPNKSCEPKKYNETLDIKCEGNCDKYDSNGNPKTGETCNNGVGQEKKFTDIPYSNESCEQHFYANGTDSQTGAKDTATATVKFKQMADIIFNLPEGKQTIISGTSFHFSIVYHAQISMEYTEAIKCTLNNSACDEAKTALKNEIMNWYQKLDLTSGSNTKVSINNLDATSNFAGNWQYAYNNGLGDLTGSASAFLAGQKMMVTATYTLGKAQIDSITGNVTYTKYNGGDRVPCENTTGYNGACRYYTPLNYEGKIDVTAHIKGLSLLKGTDWQAKYKCDVNCRNEYSGAYTEGNSNSQFYYRPISVTNPFPLGTFAENWSSWINSVGGKTTAESIIEKSYDVSNLEYTVTINAQNVSAIRTYNDSNNYLDSKINSNGKSQYINDNSFFKRITASNYFSVLGKCTNNSKDTNNCYCPLKNADGSCAYIGYIGG